MKLLDTKPIMMTSSVIVNDVLWWFYNSKMTIIYTSLFHRKR